VKEYSVACNILSVGWLVGPGDSHLLSCSMGVYLETVNAQVLILITYYMYYLLTAD